MTKDILPVLEIADLARLPSSFFLDVRTLGEFDAAHVKGAVNSIAVDWDRAAKAPETAVDNVDYWTRKIAGLGIDGTKPVVIYDDGKFSDSARVWLFLQYFGVEAFVLNGGWKALKPVLETLPAAAAVEPTAGAAITSDKTAFTAPRRVRILDRQRVKAEIGPALQIWDARTSAEYEGQDARKNPRPGHLPDALLLNHVSLSAADGRLLPHNELHALLKEIGFDPVQPVVAYCEGGGRAAVAALAAVQAGYQNVGAYYLSFADWSPDASCPVVR